MKKKSKTLKKKTNKQKKIKKQQGSRRNYKKKIRGGNNSSQNNLDELQRKLGELEQEIQHIDGRISAIKEKRHFSNNGKINLSELEENKIKLEQEISKLSKLIEEKQPIENAKMKEITDRMVNNAITNHGMGNPSKRNDDNYNYTKMAGGGSLLLIGIVGVIVAISVTK